MPKLEIAVTAGWFTLAMFVMYRSFTAPAPDYPSLFAAWLGGVLSLAGVLLIREHRNHQAGGTHGS